MSISTVPSSTPIDGKDQEEDGPKQAGSCWFARPWFGEPQVARTCILRAFRLQMPWRFSLVLRLFVSFCFVFRRYAFVEAVALRSIVLRYAGIPLATRVSFFSFFFFFCLFGDVAFSEYFLFVPFPLSLCSINSMDYRVRRTFFPSGWCFFYLVTTTGWIFYISLCENSINQPINQIIRS